jgi:hypothetical protein
MLYGAEVSIELLFLFLFLFIPSFVFVCVFYLIFCIFWEGKFVVSWRLWIVEFFLFLSFILFLIIEVKEWNGVSKWLI